jgi:Antibiotic biosynthesis monooxygenase
MSLVVVVTAFPTPEHRAEVFAAFEEAIARVHDQPGVELYALHEGRDRLVMIEKYESGRPLRSTSRARPAPTCGPPWKASSAVASTSRFSYRTRPESLRRAWCDRPPAPPSTESSSTRERGHGS